MKITQWSQLSRAELGERLLHREGGVAALRSEQAELVAEADRRQLPAAEGYRSLQEWTADRLDVHPDTARRLVALSRMDRGATWRDVADGEITVDRALAEHRLARAGAPEAVVEDSRRHGITGVHRLASLRRRCPRMDEREAFDRRYVSVQPNLDESNWRLSGELPGMEGRVFTDLVHQRADRLPDGPDGKAPLGQRSADALVELVMDGATGEDPGGPVPSLVSVFVDAELAGPTRGEAGVEVAGGPRVGPGALEELLCNGKIEVNVRGAEPLAVGPAASCIPPRLRRWVMQRDGGRCAAGGCSSRYRLQVHHILPVGQGGTHDPANLVTLCWHHHHVVVHGRGFRIDPASPPQRRRFLPPPHHGRAPPSHRG